MTDAITEQMVELCEDVRKMIIDKIDKIETVTLAIYKKCQGEKKPYYSLLYVFTRKMRAPAYHMEFVEYNYKKQDEDGCYSNVTPLIATITTERRVFMRNEAPLEYLCRDILESEDWLHAVVLQDTDKPKTLLTTEEMVHSTNYSKIIEGHLDYDMEDEEENEVCTCMTDTLKEMVEAFVAKA